MGATDSDRTWATDIINWYLANAGELVEEELFLARASQCINCPHYGLVEIPGKNVNGCTLCGCPTETKARVNKYFNPFRMRREIVTCPEGKWGDLNSFFN